MNSNDLCAAPSLVVRCRASSPRATRSGSLAPEPSSRYGNKQHRGVPDPATQEPQQIDGRLISPVDILDDDHFERARLADLGQCTEQLLARSAGAAQVQQLAAELIREVEQWPQGTASEQAIAAPPGPACIWHITGKLLHQR